MNTAKKQLVFTAGLPGAGKTTFLKSTEFAGFPVVDCDEIKKLHPDYDPKNPGLVHAWSQAEARRLQFRYMSENVSFVIDGTGTNIERYLGWFSEARELGYEVVVIYVKVKLETSLKRNAKRERVVPVDIIMQKAGIIDEAMDLLGSVADEFIVVNND